MARTLRKPPVVLWQSHNLNSLRIDIPQARSEVMPGLAMAANAMRWLAPFLVRLFPVVEPLAPRYVSYYIRRYLRDWKSRDLILDYRTRARRLGRFHYKIVVDLYLTPNQASRVLRQRLFQAFKRR